ncbi:hypothetical protein B9Z55_017910 [Caenorhabditis nigoni]|uniref:Serpentine Receptor, class H n=1 Tax=Caenorhabditis nigoni TaxID=1611254 RepID=A0A2G5TC87_9PELO|nr:hypothetical protein B9Z55_017910 [Caenorhabditis nigoni]
MQSCITGSGTPDSRYIASPEFVATVLHFATILECPISAYGAYCIIFKTPKKMGYVKWLMFNLHFWSSLSDLVMSFIGIPYILLPAPAGYGLGLIDAPRLMIYFMVTLLGAIAASIVALYENRFFILFAQKSRWATIRKPFLLFIFTMVPIFFLPPFFNPPNQETGLQIVLSRIPCQSPITYKNRKIYVLSLDLVIPLACIAFGTTIHAISSITFGTLIFINLAMLKNRIYSEKAMEIHKKFAHALTIQSAFLLSVVLAPVLALLWIMATHHHDQALNNFVFITLSLHGAGSTVMMIFVHKPYRDFTFSKICFCSSKWKQAGDEIKRSSHVSVII